MHGRCKGGGPWLVVAPAQSVARAVAAPPIQQQKKRLGPGPSSHTLHKTRTARLPIFSLPTTRPSRPRFCCPAHSPACVARVCICICTSAPGSCACAPTRCPAQHPAPCTHRPVDRHPPLRRTDPAVFVFRPIPFHNNTLGRYGVDTRPNHQVGGTLPRAALPHPPLARHKSLGIRRPSQAPITGPSLPNKTLSLLLIPFAQAFPVPEKGFGSLATGPCFQRLSVGDDPTRSHRQVERASEVGAHKRPTRFCASCAPSRRCCIHNHPGVIKETPASDPEPHSSPPESPPESPT